ncbi:MAG TPA: vitamin K epoxide reductase family protein [Terriglobales bacterium]|nr:vitamin K epoxide reductase family protein [Terriglobales bacterium]
MQAAVSRLLLVITLLALAGMVLSGVSLKNHYSGVKSEYCDLGDTFNCDLVNRSVYSHIGPVPVAAIGLVGYMALFALSRLRQRRAHGLMLLGALGGLAFALYLTYIEAYVLGVWCILCLGSLATIVLITALSAAAVGKKSSTP